MISPAVWTLIGAAALSGAVFAALIGLLGAAIQSRREHNRWIRAQRMGAYIEAASVIRQAYDRIRRSEEAELEKSDLQSRLNDAVAALEILGPRSVVLTSNAYSRVANEFAAKIAKGELSEAELESEYERMSVAAGKFFDAVRKPLKIKA